MKIRFHFYSVMLLTLLDGCLCLLLNSSELCICSMYERCNALMVFNFFSLCYDIH